MNDKGKASLVIMMLGSVGFGGCEAPHGGYYNNAVYDAPSYDSVVYAAKYSPDFYDSSHYHDHYGEFYVRQ